jgi:hypothetical protein
MYRKKLIKSEKNYNKKDQTKNKIFNTSGNLTNSSRKKISKAKKLNKLTLRKIFFNKKILQNQDK